LSSIIVFITDFPETNSARPNRSTLWFAPCANSVIAARPALDWAAAIKAVRPARSRWLISAPIEDRTEARCAFFCFKRLKFYGERGMLKMMRMPTRAWTDTETPQSRGAHGAPPKTARSGLDRRRRRHLSPPPEGVCRPRPSPQWPMTGASIRIVGSKEKHFPSKFGWKIGPKPARNGLYRNIALSVGRESCRFSANFSSDEIVVLSSPTEESKRFIDVGSNLSA